MTQEERNTSRDKSVLQKKILIGVLGEHDLRRYKIHTASIGFNHERLLEDKNDLSESQKLCSKYKTQQKVSTMKSRKAPIM